MERMKEADAVRAGMDNRVFLALNPQRLAKLPSGFRRALDQAIDRRRLADYVLGDRAAASDELLSFGATGPRPDGPRARPEEARRFFEGIALKQLGLPAMFEFIVREERPLEHDAAERIQMDLNEVGVSIFVVPLAGTEYRKRVADGEFDFRLVRQLPLVRDGELQLLGVVARIRGAQAAAELLDELGALPAGEDRAGIVRERARGLLAQLPWLPLFVYRAEIVHRSALRGLHLDRSGAAILASVWLAE
jgi:MarR-like DNA-binding transcriptional regulator SgrR of sgrS sRNA